MQGIPVNTLLSIFISLFPKRYRAVLARGEAGAGGAWLSGVAESLLSFALLVVRYFVFVKQGMDAIPEQVFIKAAEKGGDTAVRGFGLILLLEFVVSPVTLLLVYFLMEGMLRAVSALITSEIIATLPLHLLGVFHGKVERVLAERKLGPRIADEVQNPALEDAERYDLPIASCRPKPDWHYHLNTISYADELYEVVADRVGDPPRGFVYLLKKKHAAKLVRGIHHYDPNDVLLEPEKPPGLRAAFSQGMKNMARDLSLWFRNR